MATQTISFADLQNVAKVGRKLRRPTHTFHVRQRPWQIQPVMIAPVWPGETLKNLLLQARVVSDPIVNSLVGWWYETYFFYVKLRDLAARDTLTAMLMTNTAPTALNAAASAATYHAGGTPDYAKLCLDRVVETYFRDEDETVLAGAIDGLPLAQIGVPHFLDSAILDSQVADTNEEGVDEPTVVPPHMSGQFADHYAHWEAMRSMQLTAFDFEDWLKQFGIKAEKEDEDPHQPELIRYIREWTYPANTVNPTDGMPSSALSWSIAERADKDRFFSEPGFLIGVSVARPKVYFAKQKGAGVGMMNDAYSWLPAVLQDQPYTSLKKFLSTEGPLQGNVGTNAYWVDLRDLAMHGDQFVNFTPDLTMSTVALPATNLQRRFATAADADALFKVAANNKVRADGRVDLSILSRLEDTSL